MARTVASPAMHSIGPAAAGEDWSCWHAKLVGQKQQFVSWPCAASASASRVDSLGHPQRSAVWVLPLPTLLPALHHHPDRCRLWAPLTPSMQHDRCFQPLFWAVPQLDSRRGRRPSDASDVSAAARRAAHEAAGAGRFRLSGGAAAHAATGRQVQHSACGGCCIRCSSSHLPLPDQQLLGPGWRRALLSKPCALSLCPAAPSGGAAHRHQRPGHNGIQAGLDRRC